MKITFILPALGLHQLALSNEFYKSIGEDYSFIATEKITSGRFGINYEEIEKQYPYVIRAYDSAESFNKAKKVISESDAIVIGTTPEKYVDLVFENKKALILRYSERLFKKGMIRRFIPSVRKTVKKHFPIDRENFAVLCASAYLPYDLSFFYKKYTLLKWGYFPETKVVDLNNKPKNEIIKIVWAGRFVKLKHPETVVKLANKLKKNGYKFLINMIGDGEEFKKVKSLVGRYGLDNEVKLLGAKTTEELFEEMKQSDIYLFTSDYNEGWGAVLNEAMNAGCAVVCSNAPGSVPFMVKDGVNGLIYQNGNINDMYSKVVDLFNDRNKISDFGLKAYKCCTEDWSYKLAVKKLLDLVKNFTENKEIKYFDDGILSEAFLLKNGRKKDDYR